MRDKTARKRFYTPDGFFVTERVAKNNPPLPDQPLIPRDARGLFLFRVDADIFLEEGHKLFLESARKYGIKSSWFVNIEGYKESPNAIKELVADPLVEVQSHAFKHQVYNSQKENLVNLKKAEDYIEKFVQRRVKGVVAPYGEWNQNFQKALEELGYSYSSEFSLAFDCAPFYPVINGKVSSVLQIPIHPVCTGSFIYSRLAVDTVCAYFENHIRARYANHLPIILYGHPNDDDISYNRKVLDCIFSCIASLDGIKSMNFSEYFKWWTKERATAQPKPLVKPPNISSTKVPQYSRLKKVKYHLTSHLAELKQHIKDRKK
ncbi:MAG: polysaccharide deacetylase family protein [Candidatus Saganbacteria bacterium]|nr:polysaccharide deacetylase family protein [Candidatus Saganbacteria bacterium]